MDFLKKIENFQFLDTRGGSQKEQVDEIIELKKREAEMEFETP